MTGPHPLPGRIDPSPRRSLALGHGRSVATMAVFAAGMAAVASPAYAHTDAGAFGGLVGGFLHPITGIDHVIAMVAVGIWGAFLGPPALWLLPVIFPLVMVVGGVLGIVGVPIPAIETGIALSAVVLGLMVALAARLPLCRVPPVDP